MEFFIVSPIEQAYSLIVDRNSLIDNKNPLIDDREPLIDDTNPLIDTPTRYLHPFLYWYIPFRDGHINLKRKDV